MPINLDLLILAGAGLLALGAASATFASLHFLLEVGRALVCRARLRRQKRRQHRVLRPEFWSDRPEGQLDEGGDEIAVASSLKAKTHHFQRRRRLLSPSAFALCIRPLHSRGLHEDCTKISPIIVIAAGVGLVLAVLAHDWLISSYLLVVSLVVGVVIQRRKDERRQTSLTDDTERLVQTFRSMFGAEPSIFGVLARSAEQLPEGKVKMAALAAAGRYRAGISQMDQAMEPLTGLDNPYLNQFAFILTRLGMSDNDLARTMLNEMADRLRDRRRLRQKAQADLAVINGTSRFLQAANLIALTAVLALPGWMGYFLSTPTRKGTFVLTTLAAVLMSMYFDREVLALEEQVL